MPHPQVTNTTGYTFEPLFLDDEEQRPLFCAVAKATFACAPNSLKLSDKQAPLEWAGVPVGVPGESSYRYEPEVAFMKPATDVVLVGHAHAPKGGAPVVDVGFKVGPLQKILRVSGDRYWAKTGGQVFATKPQPFERVPLTYERAFGGWDRSNKDPATWTFEARNPAGRGFGDPLRYVEEGKVPLPNIEDPNDLIRRYGDRPTPAGFGFVSPNWAPRLKYAGTYDKTWDKERKPLLPKDFDRRFFNAGSSGLVASGYLQGDEDVAIVNGAAVTPLKFKLPGHPAPTCRVELRNGRVETLRTNLDTVIVNTDEMLVFLLWRAHILITTGPHDVVAIEVTTPVAATRTAVR